MNRQFILIVSLVINILLGTYILHLMKIFGAPTRKYSNYPLWLERKTLFDMLPVKDSSIVFLGNSITNGCEWSELFSNSRVINRGIGWDSTEGILARLDQIERIKPSKIFLMIGTNDIAVYHFPAAKTLANYEKIITEIKKKTPRTALYIQSILPRRDASFKLVPGLNKGIEALAKKYNLTYIDLYSKFLGSDGKMKSEFTNDGVHLLGTAYQIWRSKLMPYIN